MAFLRSVFPRQFGVGEGLSEVAVRGHVAPDLPRHLPAWAYSDAVVLAAEREKLFRPAWQVIGHADEMPEVGDFLTADLGGERALVVRDEKGLLRAFRNACRRRPHALVTARTGHFTGEEIACAPHGLTHSLSGKVLHGGADGDLAALEVKEKMGLILVRAPGAAREGGPALTGWDAFAELVPAGVQAIDVAADWKLLVEQWLEGTAPRGRFLAPNQLVEVWRGGAAILRAIPLAAGRSRLQRLDYGVTRKSTARGAATRLDDWLTQQVELAESTQTGLAAAGDDIAETGPVSAALAEFRGSIAVLLPHLGVDAPPPT
jgi:nitrite reductase/ring-hydroxylating ferredoxin subunit